MTQPPPNLGNGDRPFPQPRKSVACKAEDEFMDKHGGAGPRLLYQIAELFSAPFEDDGSPVVKAGWSARFRHILVRLGRIIMREKAL